MNIKLRKSAVTDLSPLAAAKTIEIISLPDDANIEFLRDFPNIVRISFNGEPKTYIPDQTRDEFWKDYDVRRKLSAIPGVAGRFKKLDDGGWEVDLGKTDFRDLKPLSGLPITSLKLGDTAVTDPLEGMPMDDLFLHNCRAVAGISPLTRLMLRGCPQVTDLSPLADCQTLKVLALPANAKDIEFLRAFPKLERISFKGDPNHGYRPDKSAAEFWREWDAKKQAGALFTRQSQRFLAQGGADAEVMRIQSIEQRTHRRHDTFLPVLHDEADRSRNGKAELLRCLPPFQVIDDEAHSLPVGEGDGFGFTRINDQS